MNTSGALTVWLRTWPVKQTPPISR
jgi:hypothetical protein